jgi:hypothetical protein
MRQSCQERIGQALPHRAAFTLYGFSERFSGQSDIRVWGERWHIATFALVIALSCLMSACSDSDKVIVPVHCVSDETLCSGTCQNLYTSWSNCGSCGASCTYRESCSEGYCFHQELDFGVPDSSTERCEGTQEWCGSYCIDLQDSNDHCGDCDNKCEGYNGFACSQGVCICGTDKEACDGECTDPANDPAHCGSCGNACPTGQFCVAGSCECPVGQTECSGECTDTNHSQAHCGSCNHGCGAGDNCTNGVCSWESLCDASQGTICGNNDCVYTLTDNAHCGGCNIVCNGTAGFSCQAGICSCATGQTDCNGTCTNTLSDPANCGTGAASCGVSCDVAAGDFCNNGICSEP